MIRKLEYLNYRVKITCFQASGSDVKLRSNLDGVNLNQCNKTYESLNITLTSKQICAGGQRKDDFCKG